MNKQFPKYSIIYLFVIFLYTNAVCGSQKKIKAYDYSDFLINNNYHKITDNQYSYVIPYEDEPTNLEDIMGEIQVKIAFVNKDTLKLAEYNSDYKTLTATTTHLTTYYKGILTQDQNIDSKFIVTKGGLLFETDNAIRQRRFFKLIHDASKNTARYRTYGTMFKTISITSTDTLYQIDSLALRINAKAVVTIGNLQTNTLTKTTYYIDCKRSIYFNIETIRMVYSGKEIINRQLEINQLSSDKDQGFQNACSGT